jgi:hypothetical protein
VIILRVTLFGLNLNVLAEKSINMGKKLIMVYRLLEPYGLVMLVGRII